MSKSDQHLISRSLRELKSDFQLALKSDFQLALKSAFNSPSRRSPAHFRGYRHSRTRYFASLLAGNISPEYQYIVKQTGDEKFIS